MAVKNDQKLKKTIPSAGPSITEKEAELVAEAIRFGWYEDRNMHLDQFLKEFREFIGMDYLLPTCNCTSAIHLAMISLGIGPGDEVIVPDITWVASAAPVVYVGGTPVFVDIDRESWCIDPESFENAINNKTKAVVLVDLYGNMSPDIENIIKIAKENDIEIIEDAAESIGAKYKDKNSGSFGDISVFSFNATKIMISGQGGMMATNNEEYFKRAKLYNHHGIDQSIEGKYYWSYVVGYNYQWTNIQAAIALAQLRRLEEIVTKKRQIGKWYRDRLSKMENVFMNFESKNIKNTCWIVTVTYDPAYGIKKEEVVKLARKFNFDCRPFFYPISSMPPYQRYCVGRDMAKENPVSYGISPYGISLPSAMTIREEEVDYVCDCFQKILSQKI